MSVAISIENVIKRFGKDTIINGLSLDVRPGEFFTLLGPSGCGKTTLLRMIIGFNSIEGGEIKIDGKVINNIPTNKRNMAWYSRTTPFSPTCRSGTMWPSALRTARYPRTRLSPRWTKSLK